MNNDLISRLALKQELKLWIEQSDSTDECGGCEAELLQAVVKMVDAQAAVDGGEGE